MLFQGEFDMSEDSAPNHQETSHKYLFRYIASEQAKAIEKLVSGNKSAAIALSEKNMKAVDEALKTFPNDADFHALKGYTLKDIFQSSENLLSNEERQAYLRRAHESFNRALELDPNNASAHNGLGNVLFFQGHYDEAKKETEKAIKLANGYYPAADHDLNLILKIIQEKAKSTYQQSKGTSREEIARAVNQEVQNWIISDQERMGQQVDNLTLILKTKIPVNQANKHIYDKIEAIKKEKNLNEQYELLPILIALIPQIVIGGNMTGDIVKGDKIKIENVGGDVIGVGNKSKGTIIAKEVSGTINLNFQEDNKMPDEYAEYLERFSQKVNAQLKKHNISQEKTDPVQESINELVKEVEGIKPEEKIDIEKKENIKSKITKVAIRLLKILPEGAETVATFTPLAPFSKIIGKGVKEIVEELQRQI